MSKRHTKRKRQEHNQRFASKTAVRLRKREKVARLLAYQERKEHEEAAWAKYRQDIAEAREEYCPTCPLNLVCLAKRCPDDAMICVNCASVFSESSRLTVKCDGYHENMGLDSPWHSGQCWDCRRMFNRFGQEPHRTVVGFSVETPAIVAIQRLQNQRFEGEEPDDRRNQGGAGP